MAAGPWAVALLLAALGAAALAPAPAPEVEGRAEHLVLVEDFAYRDAATGAAATHAGVGHVVVFRLVEGIHTATAGAASVGVRLGGGPDSPLLTREGEEYRFRAPAAGVFPYTCLVHAPMNGFLVVS